MSGHGDHAVGEHDLTDLYVFRKPGDPAKTILVMGVNPDVVPGVPPPRAQPFDPGARYDFMIDADGDAAAAAARSAGACAISSMRSATSPITGRRSETPGWPGG